MLICTTKSNKKANAIFPHQKGCGQNEKEKKPLSIANQFGFLECTETKRQC